MFTVNASGRTKLEPGVQQIAERGIQIHLPRAPDSFPAKSHPPSGLRPRLIADTKTPFPARTVVRPGGETPRGSFNVASRGRDVSVVGMTVVHFSPPLRFTRCTPILHFRLVTLTEILWADEGDMNAPRVEIPLVSAEEKKRGVRDEKPSRCMTRGHRRAKDARDSSGR